MINNGKIKKNGVLFLREERIICRKKQCNIAQMINKAEEYLTGTRDTDERLILIKGIMSCLIGKISFLL